MYIDSWLHVNKSEITRDEYKFITDSLTRLDFEFVTSKAKTVKLYGETSKELLLPRNFIVKPDIENNSIDGENIMMGDTVIFRNEIQKNAVDFIIKNNCCIIKCPPGFGKTVVAIKSISMLKKKALIFVDQLSLADQWIERFIQHSDLKEDDIGILDKKMCLDFPIIISTVQSFLAKIRKDENKFDELMKNSNFGVTFFDEVHCIIGPETFTTVCGKCYSKRLIGMSATPYKNLYREIAIKSWLSNNIFSHGIYELKPIIKVIKFKSKFDSNYRKYIMWRGKFDKRKYYRQLLKRTDYINMVSSLLKNAYDKNRKILVLSGLKNEYLKTIRTILIEKYEIDESEIGLFISKASRDELKKKIILSNYTMCYKGIDESSIDTLLFLSSVVSPTYIEQSIGRILRIDKNKQSPVVIDFLDTNFLELENEWKLRNEFYKFNGFEVECP
ncbi:DEAD/DEAH box helicase family protein [Candidatus Pacearchaeota archaeon]|nr:DEAD/DEAH box helicase family protein [Candidatus Pacearchaeota archaeon]